MEKLELKHLQHYPIGGDNALKCVFVKTERYSNKEIGTMLGVVNVAKPYIQVKINKDIHDLDIDNLNYSIYPLLRPMSDLYKPLEDGSIPIAVIGKMHESKGELYCEDGIYSYGWNTHVCDDYQGYEIGWIDNLKQFGLYYDAYDIKNQDEHFTGDIIAFDFNMLEYLFTHHFDVFGLIDKGLAIDINTVKQ